MKRSNRSVAKVVNLLLVALLVIAALAMTGCEESKLLGVNGPAPASKVAGTWLPSSGDPLIIHSGGDAYYGEEGSDTFTWRVKDDQSDPTQFVFVDADGNEKVQAFELADDGLSMTLYDGENAGGSSVRYTLSQPPAAEEH